MSFHYSSHTTYDDGSVEYTHVQVRELDEGEVGILLAGNNSIFDPSLTPHMLDSRSEYTISDVESLGSTSDQEDEADQEEDDSELEESWFPSLRHMSRIEEMDDDDDFNANHHRDSVTSTDIVEREDDYDNERRRKKSRRSLHNDQIGYQSFSPFQLVPLEIVYLITSSR
ncbi:hypothetical protein DM01DRAFT_1377010 [Hesseltinella vesiculosa]|uniref:Uncharacterized protein n=1 Tax=Hesseltinella vesiculosa TaxID=101127 RepID=A0A1X2G8Y1_9FUNG|nr:hypothetical protein DM01DRAFT_1377010 [Hesseltinella vesiculosa]